MNLEFLFWVLAACVVYAYFVYPLAIFALAKLRRREVRRGDGGVRSFSIVLAAYNEEATIGRRIRELCRFIDDSPVAGELIVVSDGSTDQTASLARQAAMKHVKIIDLPVNVGKAVALNTGCAAAGGEVIVFADARQRWAADTLRLLLENFIDPSVGAVSGELVLESGPGIMAGVGLYWRYEKWLRRQESRLHSMVGVTGAISAVRRELFRPIPPGTILDDVYWPLCVAMQGRRVVHDERALAFDRLPQRPGDEFRRKVRTLSANFQLITRLPGALAPWRDPIWFQLLSHKLMRLLVPWAMLGMFLTSALLPGAFYHLVFWCQAAFFAVALTGLATKKGSKLPLVSAAGSFIVLNGAAFLGFWVWAFGRAGKSWKKISYQVVPAGAKVSKPG